MGEEAHREAEPCEVLRVIPLRDTAAVVLKTDPRLFLIFVGPGEAAATQRALEETTPDRPLTHDAWVRTLKGLDVQVHQITISSIINGIFCATLALRQKRSNQELEELRVDIRASDAIIIALKSKAPLLVARSVLEEVDDATEMLTQIDALPGVDEDE